MAIVALIKNNAVLLAIVAIFILLLSQGVGQIYHQDEYRWISEMDRTDTGPHVHPPLYFLIGRAFGLLFGFGNERYLPAIFGIANVLLLYSIVVIMTRRRGLGLIAAGLFSINAYSVLAATQVDIDGAVLPFFILLMYLAYLRVIDGQRKWYWILGLAIIGGLFSKLSFVIGLAALIGDFCIRLIVEKKISVRKLIRQYWIWLAGGLVVSSGVYLVLGYFLPGFVSYTSDHIKVFDFSSRLYLDLGFKILKSAVLLGPLLSLGGLAVLIKPGAWYKYRFFWLYLVLCGLFYAVIFDFTNLTIERYFMFMIAPLAIMAVEPIFELALLIKKHAIRWHLILIVAGVTALILYIFFLPGDILPLNPKLAYAQRVLSGQWNFLIPISGGSGPIGFYVSALFTAFTWGLALVSIILASTRSKTRKVFGGSIFFSVGVIATVVVLCEFLFGTMYGSSNSIAWKSVKYVNENPNIKQIITYYDIAPYDLRKSGKYYSRFYTSPKRDYLPKITAYRGHYMIIDFPAIGEDHPYWKLILRCPIDREFKDKYIHSYVFDCSKIPAITK